MINRTWFAAAGILTGLLLTAMPACPQAYTISAKPGVVNYVEGYASLNGNPLSAGELRTATLNPGDELSTDAGKAEVLLTPGVFLRLGSNTQIHMISPSLVDTQFELQRGEAMIEVDQMVKDNRISVLNHGASIVIEKDGLYRFSADDAPRAAVLEGKAQIYFGDKKLDLGKGREVVLSDLLKAEKFDRKKEDDLYAWSNVRSQYNASVSYQAAQAASSGYSPYGPGPGAGWYWNAGFNSWAWLPFGDGAFFSPFGWGFYGPGVVGYAPVVSVPIGGGRWRGRGGNWDHAHNGPHDGGRWRHHPGNPAPQPAPGASALVPVNPNRPPGMGVTSSPWADHAARMEARRAAAAAGGFQTHTGAPASGFSGGGFSAAQGGGGGHPAWSGSHSGGGGWHPSGGGGAGSGGGGGYHGGGGGGAGAGHAGGTSGGGRSR